MSPKLFDIVNDRTILEAYDERGNDEKPCVLFVCHVGGGGTERHLQELADAVAHRCHSYILQPVDHRLSGSATENLVSLHPLSPTDRGLLFNPRDQLDEMVEVLRRIGLSRVHVHHLLGNETYLRPLLQKLELPFDLTFHDYYLLSPSYILSGPDGFHGEPDVENVVAQETALVGGCGLEEWRERFRWVVDGAERIIAPSVDAMDRIRRYFDGANIVAASHPDLSTPPPAPVPRGPRPGEPLRVLTLGEFHPHKGANTLFEASFLAMSDDLPLEFHHLGTLPEHEARAPSPRLAIYGPYRDPKLQWWISKIRPHVAWFPARWPETYSYTLSAALEAGLPVVAPRIGAFPERLENRPWTWLGPWDLGPQEWCELLESVRLSLRRDRAPTPPETRGRADDSFYPDRYLAPLEKLTRG